MVREFPLGLGLEVAYEAGMFDAMVLCVDVYLKAGELSVCILLLGLASHQEDFHTRQGNLCSFSSFLPSEDGKGQLLLSLGHVLTKSLRKLQ